MTCAMNGCARFGILTLASLFRGVRENKGMHVRRAGPVTLRTVGTLAVVLLLACPALVTGQDGSSEQDDSSTQLWANVVLGRPRSQRLYLELDIEPKTQVSGGEKWRNLDLTPLVEYYPSSWLDLVGEMTVGYTAQTESVDTFEVTPRIGARFHFLDTLVRDRLRSELQKRAYERLPRRRVGLASLVRLESRHFRYSDDSPSSQEWRLRTRLELRLAINHATMSVDRTLYGIADGEGYVPLSEKVDERFATKFRARLGLGYRYSTKWRPELLLIKDWARNSVDEEYDVDAYTLDVRLKIIW